MKNHIFIFLILFAFARAEDKNFSIAEAWRDYNAQATEGMALYYLGYVQGVIESLVETKAAKISPEFSKSTMFQVGHMVGKYLDTHPELWQKSNASLVLAALAETKYLEKTK